MAKSKNRDWQKNLDMKFEAVTKCIADTISWTQRSCSLLCNILPSYLCNLPTEHIITLTIYRKMAITWKLWWEKRFSGFWTSCKFFGSFTDNAVEILIGSQIRQLEVYYKHMVIFSSMGDPCKLCILCSCGCCGALNMALHWNQSSL